MRLVDADHLVDLVNDATILGDGFKQAFTAIVSGEPTIEPERKWETCFDCPLSNGCPKIRGCTNEQAEGYASNIPDDCPLSIEPERKTGKWIYEEDGIIHGHCSCCGFQAIYQETDVFGYDFCPNCGTKMEEGEQE